MNQMFQEMKVMSQARGQTKQRKISKTEGNEIIAAIYGDRPQPTALVEIADCLGDRLDPIYPNV